MLAHREKKTASGPLHVSSPPHRSCFGKSLSYPPLTTRAHRRCDPRNDFPPGMYFKFKESPYPSTFPKTSCFYLYKSSCVVFLTSCSGHSLATQSLKIKMKTSFVASLIPALAVAQSLSGLPTCAVRPSSPTKSILVGAY